VAIVVREIERKYDAAGAPPALDAVTSMTGVAGVAAVSRQDEQILDAVYYDTEDLRLIRAGVTLRRRTGGEDAGWHLKLPAGADTRDEIRLPLAAPAAKPADDPAAGMADRTRPLCDELKWLAAVLGQARDAEVLLARFTSELAAIPADLVAGPVGTRIAGHFTAQLEHARAAAVRELDGQRYLSLLDDLDALLADPPLTPLAAGKAGTVLAKPVRRAGRRLRRALADVPAAGDKDTAIHQARKAAKRARYAAEAAMPALGRQASRQAARAKELQGLLGDHHDSVVARTVLRGLAGDARAAGEDTFTYGVLHERQACQASEIERMLPQVAARSRK
jgi:CHAD domain-containing protein